jgi:hypothetical protein
MKIFSEKLCDENFLVLFREISNEGNDIFIGACAGDVVPCGGNLKIF